MTTGGGLSIDAPTGWYARVERRPEAGGFLHVATFALRSTDGDFAAAATNRMRADDAFAALIAYQVDDRLKPGVGLFEARGWNPALRPQDFTPSQLQVTRPGQIGRQRFFTHYDRPFCLYAVVQPVRKRPEKIIRELSAVLATIRFGD